MFLAEYTVKEFLMKITIVSSECVPFIKTGGLADVTGTLPSALTAQGASVSVIIPKYSMISEKYRSEMIHLTDFHIAMGWRSQYVGVDFLKINDINYYFIDNEYYFKQNYVYSSGDFETERFCWFCRASLETMSRLDIVPDVLHLNDWQTGLIPMLLSTQYRLDNRWEKVKTLYTIHNLRYQGLMNPQLVNEMFGIGQEALEKAEYYCNVNAMKAGIVFSDMVSTVSPTYSREIQTPLYGETLDGLIRQYSHKVVGILNGIDNNLFNPKTDTSISSNYSVYNPSGKDDCKLALQNSVGLAESMDTPLAAVISRLTNQKGIDLVQAVVPGLMDLGCQLVVLGMGDSQYERFFSEMQSVYPGKVAFRAEMNDALARRIYAGSDLFIMPSAFEPCGLSQMLALRYGSLPVVRETGGLADSIVPYNKYTDEGNGFSFRNYSAEELYNCIRDALYVFKNDPAAWGRLKFRAMSCDFGWKKSAEEYVKLYSRMINT